MWNDTRLYGVFAESSEKFFAVEIWSALSSLSCRVLILVQLLFPGIANPLFYIPL